MLRSKHCGGFVLVEFAIALPLLILLGWCLATVSVKIFQLGKIQLADYVLESEAQYVMERVTRQARIAEDVKITTSRLAGIEQIEFTYHTVNDDPSSRALGVVDVVETQFFIPHLVGDACVNINAKRQDDDSLTNPITGENYFGETKVNVFKFEPYGKFLHITLEMESLVTFDGKPRKIRINTAVFMPGCESVNKE